MKKEQMIKKANNLSEPMQKENSNSIFLKNVERGIAKNILSLSADEAKITYHCSREHIESFKDPEEKVRASYFVELILDFQYPANKIDI